MNVAMNSIDRGALHAVLSLCVNTHKAVNKIDLYQCGLRIEDSKPMKLSIGFILIIESTARNTCTNLPSLIVLVRCLILILLQHLN